MFLDRFETYVIGGFPSHLYHEGKGAIDYELAKKYGMKSRSLPLDLMWNMKQLREMRHLSIEQTTEIMSRWFELKNWKKTFSWVLPT